MGYTTRLRTLEKRLAGRRARNARAFCHRMVWSAPATSKTSLISSCYSFGVASSYFLAICTSKTSSRTLPSRI